MIKTARGIVKRPKGNPQLNQDSDPWIKIRMSIIGAHIKWTVENTWKHHLHTHFKAVKVISIKNIQSSQPVAPGLDKNTNEAYDF